MVEISWTIYMKNVTQCLALSGTFTSIWHWLITLEWKKKLETNYFEWNENTWYQILWNTIKAILRGKMLEPRAYIRKDKRSQIINVSFHIKKKTLEKEKQVNAKMSKGEKILLKKSVSIQIK